MKPHTVFECPELRENARLIYERSEINHWLFFRKIKVRRIYECLTCGKNFVWIEEGNL